MAHVAEHLSVGELRAGYRGSGDATLPRDLAAGARVELRGDRGAHGLRDEPIVHRHFETLADLDAAVARQCVALGADRDRVRAQAGFHWWPNRLSPI